MTANPVYDGTTAADEYINGPGNPRLAHAYPPGSDISLCGRVRDRVPARPGTRKCPDCEHAAVRKQWITR